jgi:hypothetical protein
MATIAFGVAADIAAPTVVNGRPADPSPPGVADAST